MKVWLRVGPLGPQTCPALCPCTWMYNQSGQSWQSGRQTSQPHWERPARNPWNSPQPIPPPKTQLTCGDEKRYKERVVALILPTESLVRSLQKTDKCEYLVYGHSGKCILIHRYCKWRPEVVCIHRRWVTLYTYSLLSSIKRLSEGSGLCRHAVENHIGPHRWQRVSQTGWARRSKYDRR